jgi:hypothetical protein
MEWDLPEKYFTDHLRLLVIRPLSSRMKYFFLPHHIGKQEEKSCQRQKLSASWVFY